MARYSESSAQFVIYNCQLMLPSTALMSALSLPVANYSSAHLADLLEVREEGGMRRARSLGDVKHPGHLPPAFMPPQPGEKGRKRVRATKRQSESWDREQKRDKVIGDRRTSQIHQIQRRQFDLHAVSLKAPHR